jgi:hypothetical protein
LAGLSSTSALAPTSTLLHARGRWPRFRCFDRRRHSSMVRQIRLPVDPWGMINSKFRQQMEHVHRTLEAYIPVLTASAANRAWWGHCSAPTCSCRPSERCRNGRRTGHANRRSCATD